MTIVNGNIKDKSCVFFIVGYKNTRNKFEINVRDLDNLVNNLNLICPIVSMVMIENNYNRVLLDSYIKQVELGMSNLTINMGEALSNEFLDSPPSVQIDWGSVLCNK